MSKEKLFVLGSTGSIGSQALDLIEKSEDFEILVLSAQKASEKLLSQVRKFKPLYVITEEKPSKEWLENLPSKTKHLLGLKNHLKELLKKLNPSKVLNAIAGIYGIEPTFEILFNSSARLLLANKESVITAGDWLKPFLERIVPVDSEHSAIFQIFLCLQREDIEEIILTASGGPFKDLPLEEMEKIEPEQALQHPRWKMGKKISIDSATLMNKGFEVIEAHYLFSIPFKKIKVIIHPQSIIHGMVHTIDGNLFALMSPTDMKFPIFYALYFPKRKKIPLKPLNLTEVKFLTFEEPDLKKFPALKLAYKYGEKGFPYTALLVSFDEAAVKLFLEKKINFLQIPKLLEKGIAIYKAQMFSSLKIKTPWDIVKLVEDSYQYALRNYQKLLKAQ
jgi:1-deoxy-D-xylulose-5-phosphate reductoisomerase